MKININIFREIKNRIDMNENPKNIIDEKALKKMIIMYSAIKIIAKIPLLYSVLNPETNSLSPSAKSNGVRFISAIHEIIHKMKLKKNIIYMNDFCMIIVL